MMSKELHTPGPWVLNPECGCVTASVKSGHHTICYAFTHGPEASANAQLVASAPGMAKEIASLKSRILDLERDGERYRWALKALDTDAHWDFSYMEHFDGPEHAYRIYYRSNLFACGATWNEAIDAAIASQKPDGGGTNK